MILGITAAPAPAELSVRIVKTILTACANACRSRLYAPGVLHGGKHAHRCGEIDVGGCQLVAAVLFSSPGIKKACLIRRWSIDLMALAISATCRSGPHGICIRIRHESIRAFFGVPGEGGLETQVDYTFFCLYAVTLDCLLA